MTDQPNEAELIDSTTNLVTGDEADVWIAKDQSPELDDSAEED